MTIPNELIWLAWWPYLCGRDLVKEVLHVG
jgi:hypothetical protein